MQETAASLLPTQPEDFCTKAYWDDFFQKRGEKAYEWYGTYSQLSHVFKEHCKKNDRILMLGCGNSDLSACLYKAGYTNIVNIDFSERVINEMKEKYRNLDEMTWEVMDMTDLSSFESDSFDVVIDKGALDALMASDTFEIQQNASRMFKEVRRVSKDKYICVTMAQDFITSALLSYVCKDFTNIKVIQGPSSATLPLAPFVITASTNTNMTLVSFRDDQEEKEFDSNLTSERRDFLQDAITETQSYMQTKFYARTVQGRNEEGNNQAQPFEPIKIFLKNNKSPRFILQLVDSANENQISTSSCGVFLIPQGREHEWIFSTSDGLLQLASGANFSRLIVVTLCRGHEFSSMQDVQDELSSRIMDFVPLTINSSSSKIPYLTVAEGIGERRVIATGTSSLSGDYIVEDVVSTAAQDVVTRSRRLVFKSNTNVIQSEVYLKKKNKKKKTLVVNHKSLAFDYHVGIVNGISSLLPPSSDNINKSSSCLVIGLGGGALPMFLYHKFMSMKIDVCELDQDIVNVATEYFGMTTEDKRMTVSVADGLKFISNSLLSSSLYNFIIIDVDAKDVTVGMSCPPVAFVQPSFVKECYEKLMENGALVFNISCRNSELYRDVLKDIVSVFSPVGSVYQLEGSDDDVNRVVFAVKGKTNLLSRMKLVK